MASSIPERGPADLIQWDLPLDHLHKLTLHWTLLDLCGTTIHVIIQWLQIRGRIVSYPYLFSPNEVDVGRREKQISLLCLQQKTQGTSNATTNT